jgi:DNA-binding winged helix-turn-helix (wHTH) protein/Flp pilus assembly protein TadD
MGGGMDAFDLPPFRVDPRTRVLYRDGEREPTPPRTVEVLIALLERRGEIVTKQELLDRVWPDTAVEEGNLSVHVSLLRRTLGDAAPIETIAKRGYRVPPPPAAAAAVSGGREHLLRGRYFWNKLNRAALARALESFTRAANADPKSAGAISGLADTCLMQGVLGFESGREVFETALRHAESAVALDPGSADAQASLAFASLFGRWDWLGADTALQAALHVAPGRAEPHLWHALLQAMRGRFREALSSARRAQQIDPLSIKAGVGLGFHLYLSQQHQPETAPLEAVLELEPDAAVGHWGLGLALGRLKRFDEALGHLRRAADLSGGSPTIESTIPHCLALAGRSDEARAGLADMESRGIAPYRVATIEAALGRTDRAIDALERGLEERDPWMVWSGVDPMLDPLRRSPAFAAIVDQVLAEQNRQTRRRS